MNPASSWYARLVWLLPGPFRLRHGEEMIFAFEEDRKRRALAPLLWDYARTFVREWLWALPWEAIAILLWCAALLALALVLSDYVVLALYALIACSAAAGLCLRSIRRRIGTRSCAVAAACCAVFAFFAPKLALSIIPHNSDGEEFLYVIELPTMLLVLVCLLRSTPWRDTVLKRARKPKRHWARSLPEVPFIASFLGIFLFSVLRRHAYAANTVLTSAWALVVLVPILKAIWRSNEHFRTFKTYVYPNGR